MANIQTIQILRDDRKTTTIKAIRLNDGAGNDTNTIIVNASTLIGADGNERLTVSRILWTIGGPTANKTVTLNWAGTPNKELLVLADTGNWNLSGMGVAVIINNASLPTGDILITTTGFLASDTYSLIIETRKVSGYAYTG